MANRGWNRQPGFNHNGLEKPTDAKVIWTDAKNLRGLMAQPLYRDKHVYTMDRGNGLTGIELATFSAWLDSPGFPYRIDPPPLMTTPRATNAAPRVPPRAP